MSEGLILGIDIAIGILCLVVVLYSMLFWRLTKVWPGLLISLGFCISIATRVLASYGRAAGSDLLVQHARITTLASFICYTVGFVWGFYVLRRVYRDEIRREPKPPEKPQDEL